jgi:hypothetical protein
MKQDIQMMYNRQILFSKICKLFMLYCTYKLIFGENYAGFQGNIACFDTAGNGSW